MPKILNNGFTFVDLFAGIGGFRVAFESVGGRCVFTSERDRFCRQTYEANYECGHPFAGDITEVHEGDIPPHDVLLAGFPCQPFSIAGVSKKNSLNMPHGFECGSQGKLFFEIARIIDHHQPRAFVLENVKNLVGHNQGKTFADIMCTLEKKLGYCVTWEVLDSSYWVPQRRERVFLVGFKDRIEFTFDGIYRSCPWSRRKLGDILHSEDGSEKPEPPYTEGSVAKVARRYTLTPHLWQYLQDYAEKHRRRGNGFGYRLFGPDDVARTISSRYYKDGADALIRQQRKRPRRLTPRECSRLMGFDTPRGSRFVIPVSDAEAYRQFGNAVVVPVVKAIAKKMLPCLQRTVQTKRMLVRAETGMVE